MPPIHSGSLWFSWDEAIELRECEPLGLESPPPREWDGAPRRANTKSRLSIIKSGSSAAGALRSRDNRSRSGGRGRGNEMPPNSAFFIFTNFSKATNAELYLSLLPPLLTQISALLPASPLS